MTKRHLPVDVIYVTASALDFRYTRICVASVRRFYPEAPIRLLAGGSLQSGLAEELARYWLISLAPFPPGDYGWGFVKLEPLFGPIGERFLVLDSDTVMTGPVLDNIDWRDAHFIVDDEEQTDQDTKRLYYDWEALSANGSQVGRPSFVFNTGQWLGTAGVLKRDDFAPWVEWNMPRSAVNPAFKCGEQGILNYVLNRKAINGEIRVQRTKIMRWPGHSMEGLTADSVASGSAPPLIVHWAGMKQSRIAAMPGADVLDFFEESYFHRLRNGGVQRMAGIVRHMVVQFRYKLGVALKQRYARVMARIRPNAA